MLRGRREWWACFVWGLLGTGELFFVVFFAFLRLLAIVCEHEAFRFFFLWTFAKNIFLYMSFFWVLPPRSTCWEVNILFVHFAWLFSFCLISGFLPYYLLLSVLPHPSSFLVDDGGADLLTLASFY